MGSGFSNYLFFIILIVLFFIGILVFAIIKLKKPKYELKKTKVIDSGNVSVFFDKEENVIIIPYVKDKFGVGRATSNVEFLNKPYTPDKLGNTLRNAMISSKDSDACSDSELMNKLGFWGWKQFSEGKRNISVHFQTGQGVVFNTTIRKPDGAYQFHYPAFSKTMNSDLPDRELGETLLLLLQKCR